MPDLYTTFSLSLANTPMFQAWFGVLDTQGCAYPTFRLPVFKKLRSFISVYTKAIFLDTRNFALLGNTQNLIPMTINR